MRVDNPYNFSAPLRFVSESYLSRHEQRTSLILGIYFGLAGLAALLGLLSAASLRDAAYGYYAISVTLMALTQAALTGIGGLHLWPDNPEWNDLAPLILPVLTVASLLLFASAVASMPVRSIRIHRAMLATAALCVPTCLGLAWVAPGQRFYVMGPYIGISLLCGVLSMVWAGRRGDRYGAWLLLGALPLVLAASFPLARLVGLIPVSFLTIYGLQLGAAIELPIIFIVLLLRSQHRRENSRRIQGLDRVDPATGLINSHVFDERLARMIARSTRLRHDSAVMIIDLVNADAIRREFGHREADQLPLRVAERLLSTAREIDSAARISEYRFGMLVEGPFTSEEAATLGPRIVARCLMPYKGLHIDSVARVRVAYALVPQQGVNAAALLARLEERLASEPLDNRRAVFVLGETLPLRTARRRTIPAPLQS